jgi:hypothetical protein
VSRAKQSSRRGHMYGPGKQSKTPILPRVCQGWMSYRQFQCHCPATTYAVYESRACCVRRAHGCSSAAGAKQRGSEGKQCGVELEWSALRLSGKEPAAVLGAPGVKLSSTLLPDGLHEMLCQAKSSKSSCRCLQRAPSHPSDELNATAANSSPDTRRRERLWRLGQRGQEHFWHGTPRRPSRLLLLQHCPQLMVELLLCAAPGDRLVVRRERACTAGSDAPRRTFAVIADVLHLLHMFLGIIPRS